MSDQITTNFSADSDLFVAEVKKAQASLDALSSKSLPAMESNMNQAFATAQKTAKSIASIQPAAKGSGTGLLQLAYFADDAQYGMKGILNNIPGIVQGLGMGAGIAGAISLISLTATIAYPLLKKMYSTADSEKAIAAAKKYNEALKANLKTLEDTAATRALEKEMTAAKEGFAVQVERNIVAPPGIEMLQIEIQQLQQKKALEQEIHRAKTTALLAEAKAKGEDPNAIEKKAAQEAVDMTRQRLEQEEALQKKLMILAGNESNRLQLLAQKSAQYFGESAAALDEEISKAERNLAFSKASLEGAKEALQDDTLSSKEKQLARDNLRAAEERLAADEKSLAQAIAYQKTMAEQAAIAKEQYGAARKASSEASDTAAKKLRELAQQKSTASELAVLAERERAANEASAKAQEQKKEAQKAQKEEEKATKTEKVDDGKKTAMIETQAEIAALRAQANGQKRLADEIRGRIAIAQQARQIAAATGMDEARALALAKEKHGLEKKLAEEKTSAVRRTGSDGGSRIKRAGESNTWLGRATGEAAQRSRDFQSRTQAWMSSPQRVVTNGADTAADLLKVNQKQLAFWEKYLGII